VTLRALAADIINDALAAANSDTRVDHRSFAERGIEREGTIHLGPNATSLERRGEATRGGDYNRHVEDYNQQLAERDALNVAIEKEERYSKSPPPERVDATERVFSDVEAFREAVKDRGAVADIQDGDGVYWWQRVASRLLRRPATLPSRFRVRLALTGSRIQGIIMAQTTITETTEAWIDDQER
jgi:hypothetical protein